MAKNGNMHARYSSREKVNRQLHFLGTFFEYYN